MGHEGMVAPQKKMQRDNERRCKRKRMYDRAEGERAEERRARSFFRVFSSHDKIIRHRAAHGKRQPLGIMPAGRNYSIDEMG